MSNSSAQGGMRRQFVPPRRISPLMLRIMAVNVVALAMLLGGLLYLDQFRNGLINARTKELSIQAQIIAGALGEVATGEAETAEINLRLARQILARLVVPAEIRGRLFGLNGRIQADSSNLGGRIHVVKLSPETPMSEATSWVEDHFKYLKIVVFGKSHLPIYRERIGQRARDYEETRQALAGLPGKALRIAPEQDSLIISVAVPVQRFKRVLGALMLSTDTVEIDKLVNHERLLIIKIFGVTMVITLLLSIFLARTIVRPIHQLAVAADKVRLGGGLHTGIPDFSHRNDEIGDLSIAFDEMMKALYQQMDAVAAFAADVSHEMKNPLSSLRSAVESVEKSKDPAVKAKLMAIIQDDVKRLDRLISDISDASRLDAELSRAKMETVDLTGLLLAVCEVYEATKKPEMPVLKLDLPVDLEGAKDGKPDSVIVNGVALRLGQVIRNLLDNAVSFSPPGGEIKVVLKKYGRYAQIEVLDQGPGIPEDKLEDIFQRFYTERPAAEAFGKHSGLGLNISRQIVLAHEGEIFAENRMADFEAGEGIRGARFVVRLPLGYAL